MSFDEGFVVVSDGPPFPGLACLALVPFVFLCFGLACFVLFGAADKALAARGVPLVIFLVLRLFISLS